MKFRNSTSGFTLIELVIVIVIIGILASVALPRFTNLQREARIAKLQAARGAVAAAAAIIHATVLTRANVADTVACPGTGGLATNATAGAGTVCTENGLINMVNAYPASNALAANARDIVSAAGLTGVFDPTAAQLTAEGYTYASTGTVGTFGVVGATAAATCAFTYTEAVANGAAAISAVTTTGC